MQTQFYVKREVNASIATENNATRVNETYFGESNSFFMEHWIQAKFVCDFDSIKQYPFGEQICSITYGLKLAADGQINLKFRTISQDDANEIDQYIIENISYREFGSYIIIIFMCRPSVKLWFWKLEKPPKCFQRHL